MPLYLVEFLVRLGVAVIADGTIKPRWYGSDQSKVCKRVQRYWWGSNHAHGWPMPILHTRGELAPTGSTSSTVKESWRICGLSWTPSSATL